MNKKVLMSGTEWFDDGYAINPFMDSSLAIDLDKAKTEHDTIHQALLNAGVEVVRVAAPESCQDGVYTANWALVRGEIAILARLPNARSAEESYAEKVLTELGKTIVRIPEGLRFSGQGDALPCGDYLFTGRGYRSDDAAQHFAADTLGYSRIALETIPLLDVNNDPVINKSSGWPDSYFYDIDLALAILRTPTKDERGLIAWCPEAFTDASRKLLNDFTAVDKIKVSFNEAKDAFACNLVSTGSLVIMSASAPEFKANLENLGLNVITPAISELAKGGGYIRCTTLTLD